ncbi:hypothetical protein GUJ93_ZPchr0008g13562 [Zizania palustris]|uniref:R13L1/DRL21-like LRR repeat region domain-containing protein n=1 Tax=Zizania palustris TaxID=103762 RepID=A0A8J5QZW5_ZIZPA|nr:hypothetical protein GUJ93_ZPchr0008g13562 [Zizania palustris]
MTSLEVLNDYRIKDEQGHKISELENMSKLRVLLIRDVQNVTNPEEAKMAKLDSKKHLRRLSLLWSSLYGLATRRGGGELLEQVLDHLRPHHGLKELLINMYGGIIAPSWLSNEFLPNLTSVYLGNCNGLQTLPAFGQLRFLKDLVLDSIEVLKKIGPEFYGPTGVTSAFPKLKALNFQHMGELEDWYSDASSGQWFPQLHSLVITVCPKLRMLPPVPVCLKYLELSFLDEITSLPEIWWPNEASSVASSPLLSCLNIVGCSKIYSLANGFLRHPEYLYALEDITIWNCNNLVHLPVDEFTKFTGLKKLAIQECMKLVFIPIIPGSLLPPSIEMLTLKSCGGMDMSLHLLLKSISSISYLKLSKCANITTLPSTDVLSGLCVLSWLVIEDCPELASLGGLSALRLLEILEIKRCTKLDSAVAEGHPIEHGVPLVLDRLDIDNPSLLLVEPLRSMVTSKFLEIHCCSEISELPEQWLLRSRLLVQVLALYDAVSLQHLPENLSRFSSLQTLVLRKVHQLKMLPELPQSLKTLAIYGCSPEFAEKYKEHGGSDWFRISHVPYVIIDMF